MCLECHKLYDDGIIGVKNSILMINNVNEYEQYEKLVGSKIEACNNKNQIYFDYHYNNIYKKNMVKHMEI